jgi:hypothetical protein
MACIAFGSPMKSTDPNISATNVPSDIFRSFLLRLPSVLVNSRDVGVCTVFFNQAIISVSITTSFLKFVHRPLFTLPVRSRFASNSASNRRLSLFDLCMNFIRSFRVFSSHHSLVRPFPPPSGAFSADYPEPCSLQTTFPLSLNLACQFHRFPGPRYVSSHHYVLLLEPLSQRLIPRFPRCLSAIIKPRRRAYDARISLHHPYAASP